MHSRKTQPNDAKNLLPKNGSCISTTNALSAKAFKTPHSARADDYLQTGKSALVSSGLISICEQLVPEHVGLASAKTVLLQLLRSITITSLSSYYPWREQTLRYADTCINEEVGAEGFSTLLQSQCHRLLRAGLQASVQGRM